MNQRRHYSLTTRYVIVVGLLLFLANIVLGVVMMRQSKSMMRTMINKNMLDVSNTAAGLLDGDVMGALTEDDVGTPVFQDIAAKLLVFQNNVDIEFIYAVRKLGEDSYVFTVDPDPVDPGAFGEEVVVTAALVSAANGIAAVDDTPFADRWGNFYSAYSPIFDSEGQVAGVVGVDFSSAWFEEQVSRHTFSIGITSVLSVLIGATVMILITRKVRRKFRDLDSSLSLLAKNVDELTEEITSNQGYRDSVADSPPSGKPAAVPVPADEIEALGDKISSMQHELERYLAWIHLQAYSDPMTQVGNTNAFQEELARLNEQIRVGNAHFFAAVFDIDNLKIVNDRYGHACGNKIICGAAAAIARVFGKNRTYRIGGDEFIAIPLDLSEAEVRRRMQDIEKAVVDFNAAPDHPDAILSLSMGTAAFDPGGDHSFREVFVRADESMYENKGEHHRRATTLSEI